MGLSGMVIQPYTLMSMGFRVVVRNAELRDCGTGGDIGGDTSKEPVIGPRSVGVTFKEDVLSTSGGGYYDIGLDEDSEVEDTFTFLLGDLSSFKLTISRICTYEEKEAEFLSLKHGNLSFVEYERKFDELSRYSPYLVDTEKYTAWHFKKGLRLELYNVIALFQFPIYFEILQRVQLIAKDFVQEIAKPTRQGSVPARKSWKGGFQ
ncbi:hypothetical protein FNV43_RR08809 [Rhamnella rubrinervis]|uniref:Retrotransposon gag domain-containing protein n=1 Tax=Rhamnella rubrinervis TaxID=2594499 RepID=A0A8K0MJ54_9ROSA|nr:hypothetical protein FNV43_RR08809 [Rhamnella rubrinervis]